MFKDSRKLTDQLNVCSHIQRGSVWVFEIDQRSRVYFEVGKSCELVQIWDGVFLEDFLSVRPVEIDFEAFEYLLVTVKRTKNVLYRNL